ncbi:MAG TPA: hypothetical protein VH520_03845 [Streptosporangiaceae bacterium]
MTALTALSRPAEPDTAVPRTWRHRSALSIRLGFTPSLNGRYAPMNAPHPHAHAGGRLISDFKARPRRIGDRVAAGFLLAATASAAVLAAGPAASAAPSSAAGRSATLGAAAAAPGGLVSWSVIPATAAAPDTRTTFNYASVQPGTTITDHVAVLNRSSQSVAFTIYATDAIGTTASNTLLLMPSTQKPVDIGTWVSVDGHAGKLSVVVGAGKGVIEPFRISVPRNARPGDHTGALFAAVTFNAKAKNGALVAEEHRLGVPMLLRVAGPLTAGLRVEAVSVGARGTISPVGSSATSVTYTVHNTGNVRLSGSALVSVSGLFGASRSAGSRPLPTVLPGDSVRITLAPGNLYPFGPITGHVRISPAAPPGGIPLAAPLAAMTGSASLFAVPWALLVVVILIGGLIVGLWQLLRWRRRRLGATLIAVAEHARQETERRLTGQRTSSGEPQGKA